MQTALDKGGPEAFEALMSYKFEKEDEAWATDYYEKVIKPRMNKVFEDAPDLPDNWRDEVTDFTPGFTPRPGRAELPPTNRGDAAAVA